MPGRQPPGISPAIDRSTMKPLLQCLTCGSGLLFAVVGASNYAAIAFHIPGIEPIAQTAMSAVLVFLGGCLIRRSLQ